jgi:uncharacterized GH25 family protein
MPKKYILTTLAMILLFSFLANSHESYFMADNFHVHRGDILKLHLLVGDDFKGEIEKPLQIKVTAAFDLFTYKGKTNLLVESKDSAFPILQRKVDFDGTGLIAIERKYFHIKLKPGKFARYLKEEGIDNITFDSLSIPKDSVHEKYSRYIKTLVCSDMAGQENTYKTITGQALEIVLLDNPYGKVKKQLQLQVLFQGKPLKGKTIYMAKDGHGLSLNQQKVKTDEKGICYFKWPTTGNWLIHLVNMIPSDTEDKDFESFWASYSFGVE